ncbi:hypothetical protein [Granulicatella adiacens]
MDTLEREKEIDLLEHECCPFKEGDEYWGLNSDGSVSKLVWDNHSIDQSVLMLGNAFKTSKEAILEADRRVLLHNFKMFRDKCNGDWKTNFYREQRHHYIDFYNSEDELFTGSTYYKTFELFGYFKKESDCDKAIELFGDEIKRLYVEV